MRKNPAISGCSAAQYVANGVCRFGYIYRRRILFFPNFFSSLSLAASPAATQTPS